MFAYTAFRFVAFQQDVLTLRASCGSESDPTMRRAYPLPLSSARLPVPLSPGLGDRCAPALGGNGRRIVI
jgi:hypothetical protein